MVYRAYHAAQAIYVGPRQEAVVFGFDRDFQIAGFEIRP
jgi:hypothetical protein